MLRETIPEWLYRRVLFWGLAAARDFPRTFGIEAGRADLVCSSPYLISVEEFQRGFGFSERRKSLIGSLLEMVDQVKLQGFGVAFVMVGGGFVNKTQVNPRDLDCVIFTLGTGANRTPMGPSLEQRALSSGIDLRILPADVDAIIFAKSVIFFHSLYSNSKDSHHIARGSFLLEVL